MPFELILTRDTILLASAIFGLRLLNNALFTFRMILIARQKRILATVLAFFDSLIFAVTVATVVTDLTNVILLFAYCSGFALGGYVGMWIEKRFVTRYLTVNVISSLGKNRIANALREHGYGVTETMGEGKDGEVTMLRSVVNDKDMRQLLDTVREMDEEAFVAVEETKAIRHGWVRNPRGTYYKS